MLTRILKLLSDGTEHYRIHSPATARMLQAMRGKIMPMSDEYMRARSTDTEIRALQAGCKPMSEIKLYAREIPGWRERKI